MMYLEATMNRIKDMINRVISLGVLVLLVGAKAFAQEWEYSESYFYTTGDTVTNWDDVWQRPDGVCVVAGHKISDECWSLPLLLSLSPDDGSLLNRRFYYKPSFASHWPNLVFNGQGEAYMLLDYFPDYDTCTPNYFHNFDNPPDYAILGLYKLNDSLDIVESHETQIPVDTAACPHEGLSPNEFGGQLTIISAESEGDYIVGAYVKSPTFDLYNPRGHDTIFFFRMDFNGNFIDKVGYEMESEGGGMYANWLYYQLVKRGDGFVFYYNDAPRIYHAKKDDGPKLGTPGTALFMDSEFNIVDEKAFHQQPGIYQGDMFQQLSVVRSGHNTVYATSQYLKPNGHGIQGIALYEYGDDAERTGTLPLLRYIERSSGPSNWDKSAVVKGVDSGPDNSIYFAYVLHPYGSFLCIERLDPEFDTIRTWILDGNGGSSDRLNYTIRVIKTANDNGLLVRFNSVQYGSYARKRHVMKFPAEAFVGIEEAHANGLKVAIAFPNPGKDVLNIFTALRDARVEIYDMAGRLMHRQEITEEVTPIDAEAWPTGTYVWKVFANNSVAETGKWVKE